MIYLTSLGGGEMALNDDHIERVESHPDTVVYLTHGNHLIVRESCQEVVERVAEARADVLRRALHPLGPGAPTLRVLPGAAGPGRVQDGEER